MALRVPVTRDEDQYSTDFGKAVGKINNRVSHCGSEGLAETQNSTDVIVLGSIAGRIDQGLGLLSEIMREQLKSLDPGVKAGHQTLKFFLVSERNITFLLPPGNNVITFPSGSVPLPKSPSQSNHRNAEHNNFLFTQNIGILPLFGAARITIKGFEWDVEDWETKMGAMVSTSNHIFAEQVHVKTDVALLFTVEIDTRYFERYRES